MVQNMTFIAGISPMNITRDLQYSLREAIGVYPRTTGIVLFTFFDVVLLTDFCQHDSGSLSVLSCTLSTCELANGTITSIPCSEAVNARILTSNHGMHNTVMAVQLRFPLYGKRLPRHVNTITIQVEILIEAAERAFGWLRMGPGLVSPLTRLE